MALVIIGSDGSREPLSSFGRGLPLGTRLEDDAGVWFTLVADSTSIDNVSYVAVADYQNLRWIKDGASGGTNFGGFGEDTSVVKKNAAGTPRTILELIAAYISNVDTAETSSWALKLLFSGAQAVVATFLPQGIGFADGSPSAPSLVFASESGLNTGWYYAGNGIWAYAIDGQLSAYFGDLGNGFRFFNRVQESRAGDVASGGTVTLGAANYMHVTGTTAIDFIATTNWIDGAEVTLYFPSSLTLNNNTGSPPGSTFPLQTLSGSNTVVGAKGVIVLRKDDALSRWVQVK